MARIALSACAALLLLSSALPAVAADQKPEETPEAHFDVHQGEAVVHALGSKALMIALDEAGRGDMTQLQTIRTDRPLPADIELRSKHASVEHRKDAIYVVLPHEHRVLAFAYDAQDGPPSAPDPAWKGLQITRVGVASGFTESCSALEESCLGGAVRRLHLRLDDVEADRLPRSWKASYSDGDLASQ
jgi:hypothetical protein